MCSPTPPIDPSPDPVDPNSPSTSNPTEGDPSQLSGPSTKTVQRSEEDFDDYDQTHWLTRSTPASKVSTTSKQKQDWIDLYDFMVSKMFEANCGCNKCAPQHYINPQCRQFKHRVTDLTVSPREGASTSCSRPNIHNKFEALHLVDTAISYFTRPESEWSQVQREALISFKVLWEDKLQHELHLDDCSTSPAKDCLEKAMKYFNKIFFLNSLSPIKFIWRDDDEAGTGAQPGTLGYHELKRFFHDRIKHTIFLHSTRIRITEDTDLARLRMGTILHELVHGFLEEYACEACETAKNNLPSHGHGRAFHRLATAVEKKASEVLGIGDLDLGRVNAVINYWVPRAENKSAKQGRGREYWPSVCDLVGYGFLSEK